MIIQSKTFAINSSMMAICIASIGACGKAEYDISIPRLSAVRNVSGTAAEMCRREGRKVALVDIDTRQQTGAPTTAYVCYDALALYLVFECCEPQLDKLKCDVTERNGEVWKDDCVEIFVDPGISRRSYCHFMLNAGNVQCSEKFIDGKRIDGWNAQWESRVLEGNGKWTAGIAIPFSALGLNPAAGFSCGMNLCRERRTEAETSAWVPLNDFHTPERFGTIRDADFAARAAISSPLELKWCFENGKSILGCVQTIVNDSGRDMKLAVKTERISSGRSLVTNVNIASEASVEVVFPGNDCADGKECRFVTEITDDATGRLINRDIRTIVTPAFFPRIAGDTIVPYRTISSAAEKTIRPSGAPEYGDVCFSSRWRHPRDAGDHHDTFRDARTFRATRLDWVYSADPAWIRECKRRGYRFAGAVCTILPDTPGGKSYEQGRVIDKDGHPITAPWMKSSGGTWWGCMNSPQYRASFLSHARLLIDGGADAIQMDDPDGNMSAVNWGGCYCRYCREKAAGHAKDLEKEMSALQAESVKEFYAYVRGEIDSYAGRRVPWSCNNIQGQTGFPYDLFDYGMAELREKQSTPQALYCKFAGAVRSGKRQVFTFVSTNVFLTRQVIATAYACGGHIIVPYDVWNGEAPRIFGKPEDYVGIYAFVRAMRAYYDGYEDAAAVGSGMVELRYGAVPPVQVDAGDVYAFIRAKPADAETAVAVHLVDWRGAPRPFVISLRNDLFFGATAMDVKLFTPVSIVGKELLESSDDDKFVREESVRIREQNGTTEVCIPRLNPYGILVVKSNKKEPCAWRRARLRYK